MTMHAAKGLEFPIVFIIGCEKDYLPFQRDGGNSSDPAEERRLFYVAMTRAKSELYLSYAKKRRIYGKPKNRFISPFVADIERALKQHEKMELTQQQKPSQQQLTLF